METEQKKEKNGRHAYELVAMRGGARGVRKQYVRKNVMVFDNHVDDLIKFHLILFILCKLTFSFN